MSDGRAVLVGYDDSPASRHALTWAVEEARLRNRPLLVCHALHWPYALRPVSDEVMAQIEQVARGVVEDGARRARELAPELDVRPLVKPGTPAAVLLESAHEAEITVLGSRGQGGFEGLPVGSAAVQVAAHCSRPVVVIPSQFEGRSGQDARIVVGLDGSPAALAAVEFALDEAALRLGSVTVLCCWNDCGSASWPEPLPFVDSRALRAGAEARFHQVTAHLARRRPDVPVVARFVTGRPQRALLDATKDAALLVLGNRGNESPPYLLLGQVTQSALLHAWCPVAVTPATVMRPRIPPD
ncbi:universal stress protein [Nonomuraea sp. NPDC049421]|uniref:universal stress protein n=1 Tax=Nonomuraea sp. NPDC049421 TaxID=3155275 RepID=UPI00342EF5DC